jgi:putative ABC transport system ATP-binding protein
VLEFRAVTKRYSIGTADSILAVADVSLSVPRGELVALYGPSGSGKSTLLLMAAAVLKPDSGDVLVDGRSVSRLSSHDAASYRMNELGFIRQSLDLIPAATTLENAALKLIGEGHTVREAHRAVAPMLERLGLGHRLEQRSDALSMGERQRVMIARALSTDPQVVLADEPTGNLDTERGKDVLELLHELSRERSIAVLLVTHDPQAAAVADSRYVLRDGHLTSGAEAPS